MTNKLQQAKDKDGDDDFFFFQENLPFIKDKDQKAPRDERNMHNKDWQQVTLTKNKTSPAISTNFPDCFHVWSFPVQMDPIAEEKTTLTHVFVVNTVRKKILNESGPRTTGRTGSAATFYWTRWCFRCSRCMVFNILRSFPANFMGIQHPPLQPKRSSP